MRIFGGVNIARFMEDDLPIEHRFLNKAIENAQKKVEGHNYDIRKHLLEYDDVMNQQRKVVYAWRREVLARSHLREMVFSMIDELAGVIAEDFFPGGKLRKVNGQSTLDTRELNDAIAVMFSIQSNITESDIRPFNGEGLRQLIHRLAEEAYTAKEKSLGADTVRQIEKMVLLTTIDHLWKDHLLAMDHLREGVGLQGYGQKDPLIVYKKEGFRFFEMMMNQITGDVVRKLFAVQMSEPHFIEEVDEPAAPEMQYNLSADGNLVPAPRADQASEPIRSRQAPADLLGASPAFAGTNTGLSPSLGSLSADKTGRNDPCPCGSGKKYKKCHGQ